MELDWNSGALAEGLRCFDGQQFFAAHEHWESVWLKCDEPQKSFLQALIQIASALHHHQRNNLQGTLSLLNRALKKLDAFPATFEQVDIAQLRGLLMQWLATVERGSQGGVHSYPTMPIIDPCKPPQ